MMSSPSSKVRYTNDCTGNRPILLDWITWLEIKICTALYCTMGVVLGHYEKYSTRPGQGYTKCGATIWRLHRCALAAQNSLFSTWIISSNLRTNHCIQTKN